MKRILSNAAQQAGEFLLDHPKAPYLISAAAFVVAIVLQRGFVL